MDRVELGGDTCVKDALAHGVGDTRAVVDHDKRASVALSGRGDKDAMGPGVPGVAQHLDDDVLNAADVVLCLAPLGLANAKADEAVAQRLLDADRGVP